MRSFSSSPSYNHKGAMLKYNVLYETMKMIEMKKIGPKSGN